MKTKPDVNEKTSTEEQETLSPLRAMLKELGAKMVPPSGTARIWIPVNPRERKVVKEDDQDE